MALIHIYDSISNEHSSITANGKLKNILPNYDFSRCVALVKGGRINGEYEAKENEVIFIRKVPASSVALGVIAIAVAVVAIGVGVGVSIYADNKAKEAKKQMEEAQKNAQRDADNLAQKISTLPFLKGAKNQKALGNIIQLQMGEMYNTPYLLTDGFYSISGTDGQKQYWNAILSLGQKDQVLKEIRIGTAKAKQFTVTSETQPQEGEYTFDQDSVYYDSENLIEVRQGTDFENEFFQQKVIAKQDGSEVKHDYGKSAEPLIFQLASNTMKVELCIQFNALRQYNTSAGAWEARTVQIDPYWSNDGGQSWHLFYFEGKEPGDPVPVYKEEWKTREWTEYVPISEPRALHQCVEIDGQWYELVDRFERYLDRTFDHYDPAPYNRFTKNANYALRYKAVKEFTYEEAYGKDILIKLERPTPKRESNSDENVYLLYHNSFCFDKQKSFEAEELIPCKALETWYTEKTARIAVRLIANDSTQNQLDEINATTCAVARIWDSELQEWSEDKYQTRNPASWLLEILTSDIHEHSKYSDNEIDLLSFGALYEYCEENNFYTDAILTKTQKKKDLLSSILQTVFADMLEDSDGKLSIVIDKKEDLPVALLNAENIRSVKVAKSFERAPDGVKVNYTNSDSWAIDSVYAMFNGEARTEESVLTEFSIENATTYEHIYKIAQRRLREIKLQPRIVDVDVGKEGDYYPMYSTVMLQLKELKQGITSSVIRKVAIENNYLSGIEISDYVRFENNKRYGIIIQAQNDGDIKHYYKEVTGTGFTNVLTLVEPISTTELVLPTIGNPLSFGYLTDEGEFDTITNIMKITGVRPNGNDGFTLELKDYNEALYEYGDIPEYKPNLTNVPNNNFISDIQYGQILSQITAASVGAQEGTDVSAPEVPINIVAMAEENEIQLSSLCAETGIANNIKEVQYQVAKWNTEVWEDIKGAVYIFNREIDGYPSAAELDTWQIRARAVNTYNKASEWSNPVYVTTTDYGTWEIPSIAVTKEVVDRTVILTAVYGGTARKVYGKIKTVARIRRIGNTDATVDNGRSPNSILGITPETDFYVPEFNEPVQTDASADNEPNYRKHYPEVSTMPAEASSGDIVRYVGTTTERYTNGKYYKYVVATWVETDVDYESETNKITHTLPLIGQTYRIFKDGNIFTGIFTKDVPSIDSLSELPHIPAEEGDVIHWVGDDRETAPLFVKGGYYLYENSEWIQVQSKALIVPTTYEYEIFMKNESGNTSASVIVSAVALCTNIVDIVHSHEHYKDIYVEKLSAICANVGLIQQGGMGSFKDALNYWALSDLSAEDSGVPGGVKKGSFRVGDDTYFVQVSFDTNGKAQVRISTDNFTITATSTEFTKEIIVSSGTDALDQTRITPYGTFYEHRDNISSSWYQIDRMDTSGVFAPTYLAENQIKIGNYTQAQSRSLGHDIGRQYLSSNAKVWHFDDDEYSQNQITDGLILSGTRNRVESENSNGIDFTPAILAVAPYCTVAKCLYGQFSAALSILNTQIATIDFWMQYLYSEGQVLFNIGTAADKVSLSVLPAEVVAVVSGPASWKKGNKYIWTSTRNPKVNDYYYNTQAQAEAGGTGAGVITDKTVDVNYATTAIAIDDGTYTFQTGEPDYNWELYAPEEVWGATSALANRANNKRTDFTHSGLTQTEHFDLEEYGINFEEYKWYHIGIVFAANDIKVFIDKSEPFAQSGISRYSTAAADINISINETKNSFILDELYTDTAEELRDDFFNQTEKRKPWAALADSQDWFIFDAKKPQNVKSNILDYFKTQLLASSEFADAVRAIIQE